MSKPDLMERIAKHAAHIKKITVPEWGISKAEPLVFFAPSMKANVYDDCLAQAVGENGTDRSLFRALLIYRQAQDKDGKKLFSLTDVAQLKIADADVLTRVAEQVTAAASIEQLEKN